MLDRHSHPSQRRFTRFKTLFYRLVSGTWPVTFLFLNNLNGLSLRCRLVLIDDWHFPVDPITDVNAPFSVLIYCCAKCHAELRVV